MPTRAFIGQGCNRLQLDTVANGREAVELVGKHSFMTLDKISTIYGEKGPSQARLQEDSYMELVQTNFPNLDLIESCHVVDETVVS